MTPEIQAKFSRSFPRTVEISQAEYDQDKAAIDALAATHRYAYLGSRFDLAIFSSKRVDPMENSVCDLGFNHRIRPE